MDVVAEQYEAYPYPARDPGDERRRLITGSPSHPLEIEHFLFAGRHDWRRPLRALFAGGGTGDGLIQLAALMDAAGRPAEITWLDLSRRAREIAEARARVRGLGDIRFVTGDLSEAPALGPFDYIDCCGVLHHLPDPATGARALARALAPGGGVGFMVYAPYGREGVYPLQAAFRTLFADDPPEARVAAARRVLEVLPEDHPFRRFPRHGDHRDSDAGFHDLLLHGRDRPFTVDELAALLDSAGLGLVDFTRPALYDPARLLPGGVPLPEGLSRTARMTLAERLRGTIKTHVGYAVHAGGEAGVAAQPTDMTLIPHLRGVEAGALARRVKGGGTLRLQLDAGHAEETLARNSAPLIAGIDGRRRLADIARAAGLDHFAFQARWRPVHAALAGWGLLLYGTPGAGAAG